MKLRRITIGRAGNHQHRRPFRDGHAVYVYIARGDTALVRRRGLEAEYFLDRLIDQRPVSMNLPALIWMLAEHFAGPVDQAVGGFACLTV